MSSAVIFLKSKSNTVLKCVSGAAIIGLVALENKSRKRCLNQTEITLLSSDEPGTSSSKLAGLQTTGLCILHEAISREHLDDCKEMECFKAAELAKYNHRALKAAKFWQSTSGRFHLQEFSISDMSLLEELESSWLPLVTSYLPPRGDLSPQRTDIQFLVSLPQSRDQFYHQDNRRQGLTLLVPLVDVTLDNGPTQLVPGSHHLTAGPGDQVTHTDCHILECVQRVQGTIRACVPAGTAVIYDSRTLHRGLANDDCQSRPVLVFRYDYKDTPAPGHTVTSTNIFRVLGRVFCLVGELKQRVMDLA